MIITRPGRGDTMKTKRFLMIFVAMVFIIMLAFALFFTYSYFNIRIESRNIPYETEQYREKFKLIQNEDDIVITLFNSTRGLPLWAEDINAELSFSQTIKLLFYVYMAETDARELLPQVRNNAAKYHIPIGGDEKTAVYVEAKLKQAFSAK